ncbi:MAG: alginate export family protein, partial [Deltaproteobacteria bacterium]|nr:alginate export family protein [Deltaproteobacteria bacterium]
MKRIILSVFAAAVTAAWAIPASAAAVTAAWAIPASAGDVTFSGQYRLRGEYVDNNDFADATNDANDFWGQRVRLTANAKATDDVSAKITLQDTRTWGAETSQLTDLGTNVNSNVDLHEAYLNVSNIFGTPVSFRAGRQELAYGDERLVGSFGWSNNGRAFDGAKLMFSNDAVNVDFFTTTLTEAGVDGDDTYFNGLYATLKQLIPNNSLDLYVFNLNGQTSEATNHYTFGARLKGAAAGVDYTAEGAYQTGDIDTTPLVLGDTTDLAAYAFAVKAGYTLPTPMKIRVGAEYDFATGADTDAGENETFQNLFPTNHAHFGIADVTGANQWSNISAWSVNASADLNEKLRLFVA